MSGAVFPEGVVLLRPVATEMALTVDLAMQRLVSSRLRLRMLPSKGVKRGDETPNNTGGVPVQYWMYNLLPGTPRE